MKHLSVNLHARRCTGMSFTIAYFYTFSEIFLTLNPGLKMSPLIRFIISKTRYFYCIPSSCGNPVRDYTKDNLTYCNMQDNNEIMIIMK